MIPKLIIPILLIIGSATWAQSIETETGANVANATTSGLTYLYGYAISGQNDSSYQARNEAQANGGHVQGNYFVQLPEGEAKSQVSYTADNLGYHPVVRTQTKTNRSVTTSHFALGNSAVQSLHQQQQQTNYNDNNSTNSAVSGGFDTGFDFAIDESGNATNSLQQVLASIFTKGLPDFFHLSYPEGPLSDNEATNEDKYDNKNHTNHKNQPTDNKIENEFAIKSSQHTPREAERSSAAATGTGLLLSGEAITTTTSTTTESVVIDYNANRTSLSLPSPTRHSSPSTTKMAENQLRDVASDSGPDQYNLVSSDDVQQINDAAEGYVEAADYEPGPTREDDVTGTRANATFLLRGPIIVDDDDRPEEDNLILPSDRVPPRLAFPSNEIRISPRDGYILAPNAIADKQINVRIITERPPPPPPPPKKLFTPQPEEFHFVKVTTTPTILVTLKVTTPAPATVLPPPVTKRSQTIVEIQKSVNTQNKYITEMDGQFVEQHDEYNYLHSKPKGVAPNVFDHFRPTGAAFGYFGPDPSKGSHPVGPILGGQSKAQTEVSSPKPKTTNLAGHNGQPKGVAPNVFDHFRPPGAAFGYFGPDPSKGSHPVGPILGGQSKAQTDVSSPKPKTTNPDGHNGQPKGVAPNVFDHFMPTGAAFGYFGPDPSKGSHPVGPILGGQSKAQTPKPTATNPAGYNDVKPKSQFYENLYSFPTKGSAFVKSEEWPVKKDKDGLKQHEEYNDWQPKARTAENSVMRPTNVAQAQSVSSVIRYFGAGPSKAGDKSSSPDYKTIDEEWPIERQVQIQGPLPVKVRGEGHYLQTKPKTYNDLRPISAKAESDRPNDGYGQSPAKQPDMPMVIERIVEKRVPMPVEKIVERPVEVQKIVDRPVPIHIPIAVHIPVPVALAVPSLKNFHFSSYDQYPHNNENSLHDYQSYALLGDFMTLLPPLPNHHQPNYHQQPPNGQIVPFPNEYGLSPPPVPFADGYAYKTIQADAIPEEMSQQPLKEEYIGPVPLEKDYSLWSGNTGHHRKRSPEFGRNVRVEYGFKPPLVPSVEIDEQGVPIDKTYQ